MNEARVAFSAQNSRENGLENVPDQLEIGVWPAQPVGFLFFVSLVSPLLIFFPFWESFTHGDR